MAEEDVVETVEVEEEAVETEEAPARPWEEETRKDHMQRILQGMEEENDESPAEAEEPAAEENEEEVLAAPDDWSDDDREFFDSLPDDTIKRRWLEKTEQLTKTVEPEEQPTRIEVDDLLAGQRDFMRLNGYDERTYLGRLIAADQMIRNDPAGGLRELARVMGVDIEGLAPVEDDADDYVDPDVQQLKSQISNLTDQLNNLANFTQTGEVQRAQSVIDAFRDERDENSNPKHPHFDKVKDAMGVLIEKQLAANLPEAYEKAVWMDESIRNDLVKTAKPADEDKKQKLAQAKKVRIVKASPTVASTQKEVPKSRKDHLAQNLALLEESA